VRALVRSGLEWIRREVYERPSSRFDHCAICQGEGHWQFREQGFLVLDRYFQAPRLCHSTTLDRLRQDFADAIDSVPVSPEGEQVAIQMTRAFWRAAHDPYLVHLLDHYWGWPVGCTGFAAKRLHPCDPWEYDSYQWHHDNEGKRLRMLVYLTDVGPEDQRMDYLGRSHRIDWLGAKPPSMDSVMKILAPETPCIGPAGTVILFDANGLHRGNRNHSQVRDSLNFRFTSTHWTRFAARFPRPFLRPAG